MGRAFLHGKHPDRDTLLGESLLSLLPQDGESTHFNEAVKDVEVSDHATVQTIQDTALPGYIVLENDNTIILQAILAPDEKLQEIFICQTAYRWKDGKQITIRHSDLSLYTSEWCLDLSLYTLFIAGEVLVLPDFIMKPWANQYDQQVQT